MSVDNTTTIGGVKFNTADIKSSGTVVKDGQELNSVFLQDGTHIEFPTQPAENEAAVSQDRSYTTIGYGYPNGGYNPTTGGGAADGPYFGTEQVTIKGTYFERINGATITGTDKRDNYTLQGCSHTVVDLSQDDNQNDSVTDEASRTGSIFNGQRWPHKDNTYHLGEGDEATAVREDSPFPKRYKGEGTYRTE